MGCNVNCSCKSKVSYKDNEGVAKVTHNAFSNIEDFKQWCENVNVDMGSFSDVKLIDRKECICSKH